MKDPKAMTQPERPLYIAELREEITRLWVERLSSLGHLLLLESERHMRVPRKAWTAYLLSDERERLCRELAEHIVNEIEAARVMQEVANLRSRGESLEMH